jgi:hypothetical protein
VILVARPVELLTYVLASVVALGGGYIGAEMLLGGDAPQARPAPERTERPAAVPAEGVELRNSRYGFSFRHPEGWRASPVNHPNIVSAVARADGVLCMVSVNERELPSDASGKPEQLSRMLSGFNASHITQAVPAAGATVSSFERATLGGQEARSFVLEASAPPFGALKIRGHATLRRFGAIVLMCMASDRLLGASDVKAAFQMVHTSFRFD